jgi:Ca2+-transporting ATPase
MAINLIMIGGQVLIISVGGAAFKITQLDGKEWGLSIGLGAISLPWGALIRKFPDTWAAALVPHIPLPNVWPFNRKKKKAAVDPENGKSSASGKMGAIVDGAAAAAAPGKKTGRPSEENSNDSFVAPPLRMLTSIRGNRANTHIRRGFREYMHNQKVWVKGMGRRMGVGSNLDVAAPGVGGKLPETSGP